MVRPTHSSHPIRWTTIAIVTTLLAILTFSFAHRLGRNPSAVSYSALLGKKAPAFNLPDVYGGTVSSASNEGHLEVINFWAPWCVDCQIETGYLENFYRQWSPKGVRMVGIVYADTAMATRAYIKAHNVTYPNVTDPGERTAISYGVSGVPETFVISSNGTVLAHLIGAVGPSTMATVMHRLLAEKQLISTANQEFHPGGRP